MNKTRIPFLSPGHAAPYGGQATPNDLYYPAALESERAARLAAALDACTQRRARRIYQVLALLGWAAAIAMGVFGG